MKSLIFGALAMGMAGAAAADHHEADDAGAERDARGYVVHSMDAEPPAGANQMVTPPAGANVTVNPNQSAVFTPREGATDLPPCTREVTDRCVQTYERRR